MADIFSKEKRHEIMSRIRNKDTKIEIKVRNWLFHHGIRYRKNYEKVTGKPDIVITKYKIAIFVHGCFWHAHENCKLCRFPKTQVEFWKEKLERNKERDIRIIQDLTKDGWNVFVLWECQVENNFDETMNSLLENILKIKAEHEKT
ncbi:MAG: DNA mismatch endonuclease Vsr [Peptoclostridium sp.]|uniref:very short patch repair endonuclease n=1 Tax=Peptoclostridium sp. TaxID=1904860 RepID=UPI00139DD63E|nr:very short patch repair endonuclease [Peptoclostridium sp.]MZQ74735.1 DNA mismatch endonuclease Vsr [Peptoclostridium sp.]